LFGDYVEEMKRCIGETVDGAPVVGVMFDVV
jgi:hypothetical protein